MKRRDWLQYLKRIINWTVPTATLASSIWTPAAAVGTIAVPTLEDNRDRRDPLSLTVPHRVDGPELYARHSSHRSHRSHSSHSSHSSHYSSSGGGYYTPSPLPPPTYSPPPPPTYSPPTSKGTPTPLTPTPRDTTPRAGQVDATIMTMRVQVELTRLGYYFGKIDGIVGTELRISLRNFQRHEGLAVSGAIDNATLSRLGLSN
ncbi:His-Xaa-Ser repeat protein HxsA [Oleomonas cavernae]|uniref:His-Xaa-Ser repeat protein HxsA n=1 Tax=Oleomonas cavernae TaxID=2320859 RepID=A0A418WH23_9PROT|nr:His-Xaa-Ser repeat protein HxsA [Oleomonas cavernae]